jgi:hypothetical protein
VEVLGIYRHVRTVATGPISLVVERSGCEADHSPPPSAEVKNEPGYTCFLPTRLHGLHIIIYDLLAKCSAHSGSRGVTSNSDGF